MKAHFFVLSALLLLVAGCGKQAFTPLFHEETLASGQKIKITSFNLVWGARTNNGDGCTGGSDCFALEFVSNVPDAPEPKRIEEAKQVFELIRPASEQWGFTNASLAGFRQAERRGHYDLFFFDRGTNGDWSCTRTSAKVFANE